MATYIKMAADGGFEEVQATSISTGSADGGKIVALDENTGRINVSMLPDGSADQIRAICFVTIDARSLVHLSDENGELIIKPANSQAGLRANGFVLLSGGIGDEIDVYMDGSITGLSGIVPGRPYFLSETLPGRFADTAPSTSNYIVQEIGVGRSEDSLSFEPGPPVLLA